MVEVKTGASMYIAGLPWYSGLQEYSTIIGSSSNHRDIIASQSRGHTEEKKKKKKGAGHMSSVSLKDELSSLIRTCVHLLEHKCLGGFGCSFFYCFLRHVTTHGFGASCSLLLFLLNQLTGFYIVPSETQPPISW